MKKTISRWLNRIGHSIPWLARLCLWCVSPLSRVYLFLARTMELETLAKRRIWRISHGPLTGFCLTGLLPDEIGPVLANSMEIRCSNLLEHLPLKSKVTLDIGGSYGYYALLLSRIVGQNGRVFSFEPDWRSFQRLTQNLSLNHTENVTAVPLCLSNVRMHLAIWQSFEDDPWNSGLSPNPFQNNRGEQLVVPVVTIDAFVDALDLSARIGLLKVDVEGAELKVLKGAKDLLNKSKPLILCELHGTDIAKQVFVFLSAHGYQWEMVEYMSETRQHILAFPSEQASLYHKMVAL